MENRDEESGAAARPGPFLFDPVLGATLFNEIQAEGLRAAGTLVERLIHLVDGSPSTGRQDAERESEPTSTHGPTESELGAILPWFELWRDLVERTSETLQRFGGDGSNPHGDGVRVGIDGSLAPVRPLTISLDNGGHAQGEMWLHNGTPADHGALVPRCGPLCDSDGTRLECEVEIEPPKIDGLPSRSSRGFAITVAAEASAAPGTYRGVVQVGGAEAVWMPIEVTVPMRPSP
ncbi:MAG TPA: hypothetical protein VJ782_07810 [Aeromicrobium sp.]|nr:hypothetical protein [Aeromicrobium sp.]